MYNDFLLYNPPKPENYPKVHKNSDSALLLVLPVQQVGKMGLFLPICLKKETENKTKQMKRQNHKKLRKMYFKPKPKRE